MTPAIKALNGRPGIVTIIEDVVLVEPLCVPLIIAKLDGKPTRFSPIISRRHA